MQLQTFRFASRCALGLTLLAASSCRTGIPAPTTGRLVTPEVRAIQFLAREVPAWRRDNHCFSCHNNGDGARALYAAAQQGHRIARAALADTSAWLQRPSRWEHNRGDPGFSDQRLARLQFAFALLRGLELGRLPAHEARRALADAARNVATDQDANGSWPVEPQNPVGSPATYGTPLATYVGWRVLAAARNPEGQAAESAARAWLLRLNPRDIPSAAVLLLAAARQPAGETPAAVKGSLELLSRSQTRGGGWGPYPDAPAEPFDTALALLALAETREISSNRDAMMHGGRRYLAASQEADGSWPATTRPPGAESYAQKVSTTSWALLALLRTEAGQ